jgi:hypothetical protein
VFSLDSVASLRKKEDIIRSGGYERDTYVPPKGKGEKLYQNLHGRSSAVVLNLFCLEVQLLAFVTQ